MDIVNVTEEMVKEVLNDLLRNEDMCKCDKCLNDIFAHAMNNLPVRYVNSHTGELFSKAKSTTMQNNVDIRIAVKQAIEKVKKAPNH